MPDRTRDPVTTAVLSVVLRPVCAVLPSAPEPRRAEPGICESCYGYLYSISCSDAGDGDDGSQGL
jgi:hypothetical protein